MDKEEVKPTGESRQTEIAEPGFTPGPWTVKKRSGNLIDISADPNGLVASVARWLYGHPGSPEENQANARLIAAAPALYEAAQAALEHIKVDPVLDDDGIAAVKQLRAALALVDGNQNQETK